MFRAAMGHFLVHFLGYSLSSERNAPERTKPPPVGAFPVGGVRVSVHFFRYPTLAMTPLIFRAASFFMPAVTWVNTSSEDAAEV